MVDRIDAELVVPVRWGAVDPEVERDFEQHLSRTARVCDVTVVDGSVGEDARRRRERWARHVRVLTPDPTWCGPNGKVGGAMTGIWAARHERVVLADDDVRYDADQLAAVVRALHDADLVLPQNHPTAFPWWAWWESGRMLLNRALATDWPGTCALRRSTVLAAGGWSADALYENLEMARTVAAVGGRVAHRPDLLVPRHPPTLRHFLRQRVRQAYEDRAEPPRFVVGLCVAPLAVALLRRRPGILVGAAAGVVAVAEAGRRRAGGRRAFPPHAPLAAPLWVLERGICAWLALLARLRGGPVYHGRRMPLAAHSLRELERRYGGRGPAGRRMGAGPPGTEPDHIRTTSGGEMTTTARDVMTEGAECVSENDTVTTAAQRMASLDVGALPICGDDDRLKGMVTDRDIVLQVVAEGQDPKQVTVGSLARGEVVTIGADDPLEEAQRTMEEHQVRRLPVIDGHRLVGMISQGDLAKALPDARTGALVESISED